MAAAVYARLRGCGHDVSGYVPLIAPHPAFKSDAVVGVARAAALSAAAASVKRWPTASLLKASSFHPHTSRHKREASRILLGDPRVPAGSAKRSRNAQSKKCSAPGGRLVLFCSRNRHASDTPPARRPVALDFVAGERLDEGESPGAKKIL